MNLAIAASSPIAVRLPTQSRQLKMATMIANYKPHMKMQTVAITATQLIKHKSRFLTHQTTSPPASFNPLGYWKLHATMGSNDVAAPPPPNGSGSKLPALIKCIIGLIVSLIQPFWKFGPAAKFIAFAHQIEQTVDMVEHVVEVVEDVAEAVENASSEIAKKLPEDGFLKEVVVSVEHISKGVGDDAENILEFINKVEKVEEEIESIVEDVVEGKFNLKEDQMQLHAAIVSSKTLDEETKETKVEIVQANLVQQTTLISKE